LLSIRLLHPPRAFLLVAIAAASAGEGGSKRYDKRHLYLQHEGTIRGDSEVGKAMPSGDMAKRDRASADKRTKLKSPFFFVSPTREWWSIGGRCCSGGSACVLPVALTCLWLAAAVFFFCLQA